MAGEKSRELRTGDVLGVDLQHARAMKPTTVSSPPATPRCSGLCVAESQPKDLRSFQYSWVRRVSGKELVSKGESWDMQELGLLPR